MAHSAVCPNEIISVPKPPFWLLTHCVQSRDLPDAALSQPFRSSLFERSLIVQRTGQYGLGRQEILMLPPGVPGSLPIYLL